MLKKTIKITLGLGLATTLTATAQSKALTTTIDSVSYSLGVNIGANIKAQGLAGMNIDAFAQGLRDIYSNETPTISLEETNQILQSFFTDLQHKKAEAAKSEGSKFLAENKTKTGVVTLPSGLQYQILVEGHGPKPTATDNVTTHYHGTLIDGEIFDSSIQRGQPASFAVNGVIKGWTEALQLMPVGSKWKLFIPSDLGYGDRGAGGKIGPGTVLIFEVELLSIDKKESEVETNEPKIEVKSSSKPTKEGVKKKK